MLLPVIATVLCAYVVFCCVACVAQSRLVYHPSRQIEAAPADIALAHEDVTFQAADGVKLTGWYIPAGDDADVVLFLHGNGGNISHRLDMLYLLHSLGVSTFIIDYRGYGLSEGEPGEAGTYLDAEAAWAYLTTARGFDPGRITIYGRSLGGAIAANLAAKHTPRALVLDSAFTSVPDLAAQLYPFLPIRWLCRFRYNTLESLKAVSCPVLVVHSPTDEVVPFSHAQRLVEAAGASKDLVEIDGGHNDVRAPGGVLAAALQALLAPKS